MEISKKRKLTLAAATAVLSVIIGLGVGKLWLKFQERELNQTYGFNEKMKKEHSIGRLIAHVNAPDNTFYPPSDAARKGELAIVVTDLNAAQKQIEKNIRMFGGSVFSTMMSYASDEMKNGEMVVKFPAPAFDAVFSSLKNVGTRVIQESTEQIPLRPNYGVMPMAETNISRENQPQMETKAATEEIGKDSDIHNQDKVQSSSAAPSIAVMPPMWNEPPQDQGYIKIVFAVYPDREGSARKNDDGKFLSLLGSAGGGMPEGRAMFVGLLIKIVLLIVFVVAAFLMIIAMFRHIKEARNMYVKRKMEKKSAGHHLSKLSIKTRPRVVRVAKKK